MERNKIWIYCRVAHEDSEALRWQREQLEAYAHGHKMDIAGITGLNMKVAPLWRDRGLKN